MELTTKNEHSSQTVLAGSQPSRGRTPAKAVEAIRLDTARRRLEETTARIETIAGDCGFSGEEQMRLAFVRGVGIPPREYRKRFASAS